MKLLIRDYLASLKEREELDAILPDLLSELGLTVYSRPRRGTLQRGVDIAAVGQDDDGVRKVFLFSVKQGDLTRQDWDGTPQALRSSLNEIRDAYIRNRIPARYRHLPVVICLTFGGDVNEQVRENLAGYIADNTTDQITFDEWNGDKIAGLILQGILREEILPKVMRSSFQKAVAMIDEPSVSYDHFSKLAKNLREAGSASIKARLRVARQLNICVWILYVWARDLGNLEAPYRASELALLSGWELLRPVLARNSRDTRDLRAVIDQLVKLHITIASELIEDKVIPHTNVLYGISMSMPSSSSLDINLALFELLGRIGLTGLWLHWLGERVDPETRKTVDEGLARLTAAGFSLIRNNPALLLPIADRQTTDIALFLQLWLVSRLDAEDTVRWLGQMVERLRFTIHTRGRYPHCTSDYRELAAHLSERSDENFKDATAASTLIPLLCVWMRALGQTELLTILTTLVREKLDHCTLQLWMPDDASEDHLYVGDTNHGRAVSNVPCDEDCTGLIATIAEACRLDTCFANLSAIKAGFWPLVLAACRHHHLPVPPAFWIEAIRDSPASDHPKAESQEPNI